MVDALPPPGDMGSAERRFWRNYNEEADKYDDVLTKSWKGDMDSILIFAGLFSATLTAFIVESYQRLEPDSSDQTVLILNQLLLVQTALAAGNSSPVPLPTPTSVIPEFRPPTSILICNIFWFLSLSFSLASALGATLVQQWIRSYLQDSQNTSPITHAKIRIYLYDGIKVFKMNTIVGVIPILIHISLFLFYAGIIAFFYSINKVIARLHMAIIACILLICGILMLLAFLHRRSPFSTPVVQFFWWLIGMVYNYFINGFLSPGGHSKTFSNATEATSIRTVGGTDPSQQSIQYKIIKNLSRLETPYKESRRIAAIEKKEDNCERERQAFIWYFSTCSEDNEFEKFVELFPLTYHEENAKRILYPIISQHSKITIDGQSLLRRLLDLFRTCSDALGAQRRTRREEICTLAIEWVMSIRPEISHLSTWKNEAYSLMSNSISSGRLNTSRCSHLLPLLIVLTQWNAVFGRLVKFSPKINNYNGGNLKQPSENFIHSLSNSLLEIWEKKKPGEQIVIGHLIEMFPLELKIFGCFELIAVLLESFCDQIKLSFFDPGSYRRRSSSPNQNPARYLRFFRDAVSELSKLNEDSELTVKNLDRCLEKILSSPALRLDVSMLRKCLEFCKSARHRDFRSYEVRFSQMHKKAAFLAAFAVCNPQVRPLDQPDSLPATYKAMDVEIFRCLVNMKDKVKVYLGLAQLDQVAEEISSLYMEIVDSRMSAGGPQHSNHPIDTDYAIDLLGHMEEQLQVKDTRSSQPPFDDTQSVMMKTIAKIKEMLEKPTEDSLKAVTAVSNLKILHADLPFCNYHSDTDDKSSMTTDAELQMMFEDDYPGLFPNPSITASGPRNDSTNPRNGENGAHDFNIYVSSPNNSKLDEKKGSPQSRRPSLSRSRQSSYRSIRDGKKRADGAANSYASLQDPRQQKIRKSVAFSEVDKRPHIDSVPGSEGTGNGTEAMRTVAIHGRDGSNQTFSISDDH